MAQLTGGATVGTAASTPGSAASTLGNILKEFYLPPVVEQLNNEVLLLQRLESRDQEIYGKAAYVPVHTGRSGGIGARTEMDSLPAAGNQTYARAAFELKQLYGRIQVTGLAMAKTSSEAGAFLQALKSELDGIRNDLKKDLGRQVYGDGSGALCATGATTASTTVVLGVGAVEAINKGQLYPGMIVDIGTKADPDTAGAARKIVSVNVSGPSMVVDSAVTTTTSHFVFRALEAGTTNVDTTPIEIEGLQKLVSTAANTVGGIDASSAANKYWDNLRDTASNPLTMDRLMKAFNQVRIAGGETSVVITSFGIQRAYYNLFTQTTKYAEPLKLQGGYSALEFMGKPLVADVDAPYGNIYLLDERFLKVFALGDWKFLDEDGNILKWKSGYDAWEAVLARYMNLGITRRNVQMVLSNVQVSAGTDPGY